MNIGKKFYFIFSLLLTFGCSATQDESYEAVDLIIYSGHPTNLTNFYVKEFQERTGKKVALVMGGGNEIIQIAENNEQNMPPDIIMGVGADSLEAREDLLLSYQSANINALNTAYQSPSGKISGDSLIPMVIIYNTQTVSATNIPKSWHDLLNPHFKGQIAMGNPAISGSTYTQLATILSVFGKKEAAWEFIYDLVDNSEGKLLTSSQDVPRKVSSGEYMVGITLENYAYEYMQRGENINYIYPLEGTTARASGIAIFKNSQHINTAKTFIEFVLDESVQQEVANQFFRRPMRTDIKTPEFMQDLSTISIINYDYQWASEKVEEYQKKWKEILAEFNARDVE